MLNVAERRLSDKNRPVVENIGVIAELTQDITFTRWDGTMVTLTKGTSIHVDEANERASFRDYYFDIAPGEYTVSYPN
jgi:hypothetical protein